MRDTRKTDERLQDHPAAEIETVIVDPDDIVETFRRNAKTADPLASHVLRLRPPFEEEIEAEPYEQDGPKRYPPEQNPEPIHLDPATFVENDDGIHPNETHLTVPTREEAIEAAQDDHGEDVDDETIEEYHDELLAEWESAVRGSLLSQIRIYFEVREGDEIWTDAKYESTE